MSEAYAEKLCWENFWLQHRVKEMQENATTVSLEAARNKAITFKLKETLKPVLQTPRQDCSHQSEDLPQMERVEQKKPTSSLLTTEGKNPEDSADYKHMNPCEQNNNVSEYKDALEKIKKAQVFNHHIKEELAMSEWEDEETLMKRGQKSVTRSRRRQRKIRRAGIGL